MKTWGDVYWHYRRKGEDNSSAAYRADEWERRRNTAAPIEPAGRSRRDG